jgi:hypothetical protein
MPSERIRLFSGGFDDEFSVGSEPGNRAFFGRNVLRGLIAGIDDFIQSRQPRWDRYRSLGPALLGCALWIDDDELLDKLGELSAACVVVRKQGRSARERARSWRNWSALAMGCQGFRSDRSLTLVDRRRR